MPGNCLYAAIAGKMLPPEAISMFSRLRSRSATFNGVPPAQMIQTILRPGWSFSFSMMRW